MTISILHISDLHRDRAHPISNASLIDSLHRDFEQYAKQSPPIQAPQLVIVTGDIVQGVGPKEKAFSELLKKQYSQAEELLGNIASDFLSGDREKLVVVPGNHDVCFPTAIQAFKTTVLPVDEGEKAAAVNRLRQSMTGSNPTVRWDWQSLNFLELVDSHLYSMRFQHFADFYSTFYGGKRTFSLDPDEQFTLFDYPEYGITITAFNSCYGNDPLHNVGAIKPECISGANAEHRIMKLANRLRIAVWHHSLAGPPEASDYLDSDTAKVIVDSDYRICLHGHQHKADAISEALHFFSQRKSIIISAGSMCAGPGAIPPGFTRSYNVIEVEPTTGTGKLHVRQAHNTAEESIIWGPGSIRYTNEASVSFQFQAIGSGETTDIALAEQLIAKKDYVLAERHLANHWKSNSLARRLYLECLVEQTAEERIIRDFFPPQSIGEWIHVHSALVSTKATEKLTELMDRYSVEYRHDPTVRTQIDKYVARKRK